MLEKLKQEVYEANMALVAHRLVLFTWGNASGIDREKGLFAIKPSGVPYDSLKPENMVIIDLEGRIIEGKLNPSTDMRTHLELYRNFPTVGGVVHTHSTWATAWAQAGRAIPAYGTTHADYFYGAIPCAAALTKEEINEDYERNTGKHIVSCFAQKDPLSIPAVLCRNHGPFAWGKNVSEAVFHAAVLEEVAKMAAISELVQGGTYPEAKQFLLDKHYERKHGKNAYYGQVKDFEEKE